MQRVEQEDIIINTYPLNYSPRFAIVMPVHNEEDSIESIVMDFYNELQRRNDILFEIILAEDGSTDRTKEIIIELSKKIPLKAILSYKKKGYAGGIKSGLNLVSAPYVLITDSDGQHKPEDFWRLKNKFEELGYPENYVISGSRIRRADHLHRRIMSKVFQTLNKIVFDLPNLNDITSAFKLMSTHTAKRIASECKYMKESFWTEFTIRCIYNKITIVEVPVSHVKRLKGDTVVYKKSKIPKIVKDQIIALIKLKRELSNKSFLLALLETKSLQRLLRFMLVGASGAILILLLTWIGVEIINLHYLLSAAIAIESSIFWSFFLNDKITFKDIKTDLKLSRRLLKYHIVALSGLGINLSILYILTSNGIFYLISEGIAILIAFIFNFVASKRWVWK